MLKRALLILTVAGIYVWIRRRQEDLLPVAKSDPDAEANWANEGGGNPAPVV